MLLKTQVPSSLSKGTTSKVTTLLAGAALLWVPGWPQKTSSKEDLPKAILCPSKGYHSVSWKWHMATHSSQVNLMKLWILSQHLPLTKMPGLWITLLQRTYHFLTDINVSCILGETNHFVKSIFEIQNKEKSVDTFLIQERTHPNGMMDKNTVLQTTVHSCSLLEKYSKPALYSGYFLKIAWYRHRTSADITVIWRKGRSNNSTSQHNS